jgi:hypothetical protein
LIEEDEHAVYSKLFLKAVLSSGVYSRERIIYATSASIPASKLLQELPAQIRIKVDNGPSYAVGGDNPMKIAFRYSDVPLQDRTLAKDEEQVDYGTTITEQEVERLKLRTDLIETVALVGLLDKLKNLPSQVVVDCTKTRIVIENFEELLVSTSDIDLPIILYELKSISRNLNCVVIISINYRALNARTRSRLQNMSDCVFQFDAFEENNKTYPDYEGVLNVQKLPKVNTLNYVKKVDTLDLGFQMKRNNRYLVVDKLCLPPELGDTPSRTSCNTTNKKLDF